HASIIVRIWAGITARICKKIEVGSVLANSISWSLFVIGGFCSARYGNKKIAGMIRIKSTLANQTAIASRTFHGGLLGVGVNKAGVQAKCSGILVNPLSTSLSSISTLPSLDKRNLS